MVSLSWEAAQTLVGSCVMFANPSQAAAPSFSTLQPSSDC
jgi:hypothetical protein